MGGSGRTIGGDPRGLPGFSHLPGKPIHFPQKGHLWRARECYISPGLIKPWLMNTMDGRRLMILGFLRWCRILSIHRRVSPFSGDSSLLEGAPPLIMGGLLILGQHYSGARQGSAWHPSLGNGKGRRKGNVASKGM